MCPFPLPAALQHAGGSRIVASTMFWGWRFTCPRVSPSPALHIDSIPAASGLGWLGNCKAFLKGGRIVFIFSHEYFQDFFFFFF